jgi:GTPase SAR1 family protein
MILVGNKCDLENERIITKLRALEFAQQHQVEYIETSALKNINITESIELLLSSVMKHVDGHADENVPKPSPPRKSSEQINPDLSKKNFKSKTHPSYCCNY